MFSHESVMKNLKKTINFKESFFFQKLKIAPFKRFKLPRRDGSNFKEIFFFAF